MRKKDKTQQGGSVSSKSKSQDDNILELFQNSLGPSEFFLKRKVGTNVVNADVKNESDNASFAGNKSGTTGTVPAVTFETLPSGLLSRKEDDLVVARMPSRKRKRDSDVCALEDRYLERLVRDEKDSTQLKAASAAEETLMVSSGPLKNDGANMASSGSDENLILDGSEASEAEESPSTDPIDDADVKPEHEELQKSSCTVFLANVSTAAISSKSDRKVLKSHLTSFRVPIQDDLSKPIIESLRFRSTPFSDSRLPRKAAFIKKALMASTAKSTHAYAVYDSPKAAKEAVRHLNGSIVLGRHLRVDGVAHPTAQDHRRCVFIGNIGFVDDETAVQNASQGSDTNERVPKSKPSADYEEGLWRVFEQCGKLENVRLVRAQANQIGKGFAYVQFEDVNAVEKALLYDGKKFPPLLPRKLRVLRAKKILPKPGRTKRNEMATRFQELRAEVDAGDTSTGRASKLYGRAGAAQLRRAKHPFQKNGQAPTVFEGQRATSNPGKSMGRKRIKKKNGRSERAASFKRQRLQQ